MSNEPLNKTTAHFGKDLAGKFKTKETLFSRKSGGGMIGPHEQRRPDTAQMQDDSSSAGKEALKTLQGKHETKTSHNTKGLSLSAKFKTLSSGQRNSSQASQAQSQVESKAAEIKDKTKKAMVDILTEIRDQGPILEQLKAVSPDAYKSIKDLIQMMLQLSQMAGIMDSSMAGEPGPYEDEEGSKEEVKKAELPMPQPSKRTNLTLPVGATHNKKLKIKHKDTGKEGWISLRSGIVMDQSTGQPKSAKAGK